MRLVLILIVLYLIGCEITSATKELHRIADALEHREVAK